MLFWFVEDLHCYVVRFG